MHIHTYVGAAEIHSSHLTIKVVKVQY